jgi:hypothetical protein
VSEELIHPDRDRPWWPNTRRKKTNRRWSLSKIGDEAQAKIGDEAPADHQTTNVTTQQTGDEAQAKSAMKPKQNPAMKHKKEQQITANNKKHNIHKNKNKKAMKHTDPAWTTSPETIYTHGATCPRVPKPSTTATATHIEFPYEARARGACDPSS